MNEILTCKGREEIVLLRADRGATVITEMKDKNNKQGIMK
jgi:hypothetical protein